jgi:glycosyltransferase involved in cell wall biosynthesis
VRSVLVTKFAPLPADSGGKRRSLAILERLAARGPTVLCAFDEGAGDLEGLRALGVDVRLATWPPSRLDMLRGGARTRTFSSARFWSSSLRKLVLAATREASTDVLQIEYAQLASYGQGAPAKVRTLDLHNIESSLFKSYGSLRGGATRLALNAEARLLRRTELGALDSFDLVAVVSDTDRARLPDGRAEVIVCPNGWDDTGILPPSNEPVVVFVALMGWAPNVDAAVFLGSEIWPLVRRELPEARLVLVGRDPDPRVLALAAPDIEVTGAVADVRPYLARARVATAPLRAGGGSRLKILEALSAGRPVVATSQGVEGLEDLVGQGVEVADGATEVAAALVRLLRDPELSVSMGRRGHAAVTERYSWDETLRPLFERYDNAK